MAQSGANRCPLPRTAFSGEVPPGRLGRAENIVGGALAPDLLDPAASEGAFRHLRVLQQIASMSGGNRAAGTPGYDRSAAYVADRLKEAGYLVHFEEFEFPFFEERTAPRMCSVQKRRQRSTPNWGSPMSDT
jgi:hypothetical protein